MKITEVKYARKYNLGNYESEDYGLTAIVEEDDKASDVFAELKQEITAAQSGEKDQDNDTDDTSRDQESEDQDNESDDEDANGKGNEETNSDDSDEDDEEGNDDAKVSESNSGNDEDEDDEEDEADKKPAKKSKASTAGSKVGKAKATKKKLVKKPQAYERTNDTHKDIFSGLLKEVAPNWKKDEKSKKLAKSASVKLEGQNFLDADGEVVATFKQSVKKHMGIKK